MKKNFTKLMAMLCLALFWNTGYMKAQDYCTPYSPSPGINYITAVSTTDGIINISSTSSTGSGTSSGYTDYYDVHEVSAVQGTSFDFSVTETGSLGHCKIWIDWNQDGDFDDEDELVYSFTSSSGSYTFTGTITVPLTAVPGSTRMRVRTNWYMGYALTACTTMDYGEAEDYKMTVVPADPCEELELVAGTLTDMEICPSVTFVLPNSGTTLGLGFERVWQSSPEGEGTWTTITGAEGVNLVVTGGITDATDYRCIVTCTESGESDTTNVATVTLSPFYDCYCSVATTYLGNNYITYAETTLGVSNFSVSSGGSAYSDYTGTDTVSQVQGFSVDFEVNTYPSGSNCNLSIWVDWNQNGVFEDAEEVYTYLTSSGAKIFTGTITVPVDAVPGPTRMRIRSVYYYSSWYTYGGVNPCGTVDYGEAEDYIFNVIEAIPCEELDLVAGTLEDFEICPSVPFTVINSGTAVGAGFERIWQSSPAGEDDWTTVYTGTDVNYVNTAGITDPTDYRCIVICTESGESDTTNVATVTLSSFMDCYCSVATTWLGNNYITYAETTFGVSNFSVSSGGSAYSDYTGTDTVAQLQGFSVDFEVNTYPSGSNCNLSIWVDWNQNGLFEDAEEVYTYLTSSGAKVFTGTITVPYDAIPGPTRMRIRSVYYYSSWYTYGGVDPCGLVDYGEAEDYIFNVIEAIPCEELDLVAGTLEDFDICPSVPFVVMNSGTSLGAGFERIWQASPAGEDDWTTVYTGTDVNYVNTAGITDPTDYRCIVICTESGESDTTNVATVTLRPFTDCYCEPYTTYAYNNYITFAETTLGSVNFSRTSDAYTTSPGYSDFTATDTVEQMQTASVDFEVKAYPSGSNCNLSIWVDWNQNGLFEDAEEVYSYFTSSGAKIFTGTITVPLTAVPGPTRMRIRSVYYYSSWYTYGDVEPCGTVDYGEAEDYIFNVIAAIPCSDPAVIFPESANSVSLPEHVCGTGDITLSVDSMMPISTGITYQWQASSTGTGGWTDISAELMQDEFFYEDVSEDTYFRCKILCEGELVMYSSTILVQSVIPEVPVLFDGQSCGPGPVTLTGTVGSGTIFWFETETGGTPFASGDTVETPPIETTTTFYGAGGAFPPALVQIGTGTGVSSIYDAGPFNNYYRKYTMQLLYKKDQIEDAGGMTGLIDEMRFNLTGLPDYEFPDYTISIKTVPASSMTTLIWQTDGFDEVFGGTGFTYMPTETGWQTYPFSTPIFWDGNSHIIVKVCWSQISPTYSSTGTHQYTSTTGQMLYYRDDGSGSACGIAGASTLNSLPNVIFNFPGCSSERVPVVAYVRDTPYVQIDAEDGEYCLFNDLFTIPTSPEQPEGTTYLWSTGGTNSSITVTGSGIPTQYWVEVTNEWGCTNSDTVHLTLKPSPEVDLGPDTMVCEGGAVLLDAGNDGDLYYWNTGETTRTIIVEDGGNYTALVTNEYGCMGTDTIHVTVEGFAPTIDGIIVDNLSPTTFQFTPFHPENIIDYYWTFGDGTSSDAMAPTKEYAEPGTYMVTLQVTSTCGENDYYTYATIVQGIDETELSKNNLRLYPNPTDNLITVETIGDVKMNHIKVINMLGQEIMSHSLDRQSSVVLDVSRLASGMYHVQIESDKGTLVKKFQVLR